MKEKVLVTGADGMLGSNLVRELLSREYSVRALIQSGRNTKTLRGLHIELVVGDILNLGDVEKAMKGLRLCYSRRGKYIYLACEEQDGV